MGNLFRLQWIRQLRGPSPACRPSSTRILKRLFVAIWLACVLAPSAWARPLEMALVVGNNRHKAAPSRNLRFADDDALRFALHFRSLYSDAPLELLMGVDDPSTATRLQDLALPVSPPTREGLERAMARLRERIAAEHARGNRPVTLFFYFSGHGEQDGSLHLEDDYLPARERWTLLSNLGADRVFALLDGCYLGNERSGEAMLAPPPELFPSLEHLRAGKRPPNAGYIGATTPVPELDSLRGGLLTLVAINGLLGLADVDGDQRISFHEWGRYVQLELRGRAGAPVVKIVKPERDPLATVVDLRGLMPVGLILERDFPSGLVQVTRAGTRELVAQLRHERRKRDTLRLPPGRYDVVRFLRDQEPVGKEEAKGLREKRVYPAGWTRIEVGGLARVVLDGQTPLKPTFLIPAAQRGAALADDASVVVISEEDERFLTQASSPTSGPSGSLAGSSWGFGLRLEAPVGGVRLGEGETGWDDWRGLGLVSSRRFPVRLRSRWLVDVGIGASYLINRQRDVYGCQSPSDTVCRYPEAYRHQVRLGPSAGLHWMGPGLSLSLEPTLSWAPSLLTTPEGMLVVDWAHDQDVPFHQWRYSLLGTLNAELALRLLTPLGSRWALGPALHGDLEMHNKLNSGHIMWQVALGLEVRQRSIRP